MAQRRNVRAERFAHRGRVASPGYPEDIEAARTRKRGKLIARGFTDRPFGRIDAAHLGQEDYRARKDPMTAERFGRRVGVLAGLRYLRVTADPDVLYAAYTAGHAGVEN